MPFGQGRPNRVIYEMFDDYVVMLLGTGQQTAIDRDFLPIAQKYRWICGLRRDSKRVVIGGIRSAAERINLHHLVVGASKGQIVDHIDGDTLNNRRANLRICTLQQNNANLSLQKRSKVRFKGVHTASSGHKFRAYGTLNKRQKHLGCFDTAEEAARAYDVFARKNFGEFACLNFPNPGEQSIHRSDV